MDNRDLIKVLQQINITLAKMEVDVRHHIKRTDALESKVQKIWYLVVLGAGAGAAQYGPTVLKLIGLL